MTFRQREAQEAERDILDSQRSSERNERKEIAELARAVLCARDAPLLMRGASESTLCVIGDWHSTGGASSDGHQKKCDQNDISPPPPVQMVGVDSLCFVFMPEATLPFCLSKIEFTNRGTAFASVSVANVKQAAQFFKAIETIDGHNPDQLFFRASTPIKLKSSDTAHKSSESLDLKQSVQKAPAVVSPVTVGGMLDEWRILVPRTQLLTPEQLAAQTKGKYDKTWTWTWNLENLEHSGQPERAALLLVRCWPFVDQPKQHSKIAVVGFKRISCHGITSTQFC